MARRIAGEVPCMERDAAWGKPLHVRHRSVIVGLGTVVRVLLQDREDARGGFMAGLAARYRRGRHWNAIAEQDETLRLEIDDDERWAVASEFGCPDILAGFQNSDHVEDGAITALHLLRRSAARYRRNGQQ